MKSSTIRVDPQRLERCLNPRHIALVGGKEVEKVLMQCRNTGYQGDIWVVNPNREHLGGISCFSDISQCPSTPDTAFIAISAKPTIELVKYLSDEGNGGAVCYASGFGELGERGMELQHQLVKNAGAMPLLGPNCHGYINGLSGAALWPDQHGIKKVNQGVAIVSSSGNISINISLQQRALPIALLATVGNQAVMGIEEIVYSAIRNPQVTVIGLHIEGITNLPLFIELMQEAKQASIPVVVLKAGKSAIGSRITMSHTATMAGEFALYDALFERLSIAQVSTVEEFIETLKFLSVNGVLQGNKIASMSCSGGEASLIADLSTQKNLEFPPLKESHKQQVQQTLNEFVDIENPLDYHTFIWGDYEKLYSTFSAMLNGQFDLTMLILDFPVVKGCDHSEYLVALDAFIDAVKQQSRPAALVVSLPESIDQQIMQKLVTNGISPLLGFEQALCAIEASYLIYQSRESNDNKPEVFKNETMTGTLRFKTLSEDKAKALLQNAHCQVPKSCLITRNDMSALESMSNDFPLVVKAVADTIQHKTEIGGVILNINNRTLLIQSINRLLGIADRVLIEQMVEDVVAELLISISYDEQFGYYLVLGSGGVWVESLKDRRIVLLPANAEVIKNTLNKLKIAPFLNGYRGKSAINFSAVVETIYQIIDLVLNKHNNLLEVEINPLLVNADMAFIADALITQITVD